MRKSEKGILAIGLRELDRIVSSRSLMLLAVVIPLILFLLFAWIYERGIVRDLPVAICDLDRGVLSRTVVNMVEASSSMKIEYMVSDPAELRSLMLAGRVQGAIIIPQNFERDIKHGKRSAVTVYKNSANLIVGNLIYRDAQTIIRTVSAGVVLKKLQSAGMDKNAALGIVNPVRLEVQSLYNANYNYQQYLVPGLIAAMLQMLVMMIAAVSINAELAGGGIRHLARMAGGSSLRILAGKALGYLPVHAATVLAVLGIVFPLFGIQISGFVPFVVLYFLYFILASFLLGCMISCIFRDSMMATVVIVFINTPAFIFSGFTWPLWAMPGLHRAYAEAMPFTHFLSGFLKSYQMDAPVRAAAGEFVSLSIFVAIGLAGSLAGIRYLLRRDREGMA